MCPRLGEGLSGQGAWSQDLHTAAHCPELRATSQHQGGLVLLPLLWGSVSVPGGWQPKVAAQTEPGPVPTMMLSIQERQSSPVGGKAALTATRSGAAPERAAGRSVYGGTGQVSQELYTAVFN